MKISLPLLSILLISALHAAELPQDIANILDQHRQQQQKLQQQTRQDLIDTLASLAKKYRDAKQLDKAATVEAEIRLISSQPANIQLPSDHPTPPQRHNPVGRPDHQPQTPNPHLPRQKRKQPTSIPQP